MKTNYRLVNDGHYDWLQYEKVRKIFFFFKIRNWYYVPKVYYNPISGRDDIMGWNTFISGWECSYQYMKDFPKNWPNIEDYLKQFRKDQAALKKIKDEEYYEKIKNKGKITQL